MDVPVEWVAAIASPLIGAVGFLFKKYDSRVETQLSEMRSRTEVDLKQTMAIESMARAIEEQTKTIERWSSKGGP